jgi:PleD family two-component response regulator
MGNLYSLNQFKTKYHNSGIYTILDVNDLDSINQNQGYDKGDEALKSIGQAVNTVAQKHDIKCFKNGGQFITHAPTSERANVFKDDLIKEIKALGMVNGQHKMSVSVGTGYSQEHAESALKMAKLKLYQDVQGIQSRVKAPGQEDNVDHNLLHEQPHAQWRSMAGYGELAPHEENTALLPKETKSPLKPDKG